MALRSTVLIAAADLLPTLQTRAFADGGDLFSFTDTEALRALEAIMTRRPAVVTVERRFAATPRGAALINRIKADPALSATEIRVVSADADHPPKEPDVVVVPHGPADAPEMQDEAGTREASRHALAADLEIMIERNAATLVDLSPLGAQVVSVSVLKPNQRVRVTMSDEQGTVRVNAVVTWATFEIPHRYRAGLQFLDADAAGIDAFARRHPGP